jgi:NSS family neurotransmitter:Na+ symporter
VQFPVLGDFMEFLTDRLLLPINALTACLLAGWAWGSKHGIAEVRQNGKFPFALGDAWSISVKVVAPIAIVIIIIFGLIFGMALS